MKKVILIISLLIAIVIVREFSSVDEFEAKQIAIDILSEKNANKSCGGNFERYLILDQENPLGISTMFNFDTS